MSWTINVEEGAPPTPPTPPTPPEKKNLVPVLLFLGGVAVAVLATHKR